METGLIIYTILICIVIGFVIAEHSINKLKDESRLKKWWRQHVIGYWNSNHPKV